MFGWQPETLTSYQCQGYVVSRTPIWAVQSQGPMSARSLGFCCSLGLWSGRSMELGACSFTELCLGSSTEPGAVAPIVASMPVLLYTTGSSSVSLPHDKWGEKHLVLELSKYINSGLLFRKD